MKKYALDEIFPHLLFKLNETDLVKQLKDISKSLTSERTRIGEYVLDDKKVSAYTLFYLPTNIPKLSFLLERLDESLLEDLKDCAFVDYGSGPGTYTLAWADFFSEGIKRNFFLIDNSQKMLKQAQKLAQGIELQGNFFFSKNIPTSDLKDRKTVICFGHSLNEMKPAKAVKKIESIDSEYVLFIEPGTPESFEKLLEVRKSLLSKGYDILFPCLSSENCPLDGSDKKDWCHQVIRMNHDPSVERLSQLISLDRKSMPVIIHLYKKSGGEVSRNYGRFFRFLKETKYSFDWQLCVLNSGKHEIINVEIPKKILSKKEVKKFKENSVGLNVYFEVDRDLGGGKKRLRKVELK